jgi:hypothetical protein
MHWRSRWQVVYDWIHTHEFLVLVLVGVVIFRLPNLLEPYWYGDEGIYLTVGQGMRHGLKLYAEIVDHKTPMIYWIAAAAYTLTNLKVVLMVASLVSVWFFYLVATKVLANGWPVWAATIAFALLTTLPRLEGHIANGELLLMPMILAGVAWFWMSRPKVWNQQGVMRLYSRLGLKGFAGIGGLFSLALLLKVPAGFDFAAWGAFMLLYMPHGWDRKLRKQTLIYGLASLVGFAGPILLSIIYFWLQGTLADYFDFGLLYNFRYVGLWEPPFTQPVLVFLTTLKGRSLLLAGYLVGIWLIRKWLSVEARFVMVWFGFSLFASLLSLRPYPHYLIQVLPALSLMLGMFISGGIRLRLLTIMAVFNIFIIWQGLGFQPYPTRAYLVNFWQYMWGIKPVDEYRAWFDTKTPGTYEMAYWLKTHVAERERIFIWGNEPMVYALSQRSPAGRFVVDFHIASINAYEETLADLERIKPLYVLDYVQQRESFPDLYSLLADDYIFVQELGRAQIYRQLDK